MSEQTRVNISYTLEGDEAERFLDYKKKEFIKNNAEAARKLALERLHQVTTTRKSTKRQQGDPTKDED